MPDSSTILLVDDEDSVQKLLDVPARARRLPRRPGARRRGGAARFAASHVDLVVLDIMLPKLDGLEVCKRLRAPSMVPIIMLTARDDELDKVLGLELGADDYITKPFSIREFRSRVRALLRRAAAPRAASGDGRGDRPGRRADRPAAAHRRGARRRGAADVRRVRAPEHARGLARAASSRAGSCSSALCGGADYREPRTIDVHVRHLREKLEATRASRR